MVGSAVLAIAVSRQASPMPARMAAMAPRRWAGGMPSGPEGSGIGDGDIMKE